MNKTFLLRFLLMAAIAATPLTGQDLPPATDPSVAEDGYWVDSAPLNDVFQYLASEAELQYFFNNSLTSPEHDLTGHLRLDDPLQQMEDVAVAFGLSIYRQGSTVYAMTEAQLTGLPVEVMRYQLKYLRSSRPARYSGSGTPSGGGSAELEEFEKLKTILTPMLTSGAGAIAFEAKTNTLLVSDNSVKLRKVLDLLEAIDQPKPQIAISVRVLRVSNTHGKTVGVDWRSSLGDGIPVSATQSLNAIFNLPEFQTKARTRTTGGNRVRTVTNLEESFSRESFDNDTTTLDSSYETGAGLVFNAIQVEAIVRALEEDDIVSQEAAPTVITEDNEQGLITIVDRFPIITSTVSETTAGSNISEEVRYQVDEGDPDPTENPEQSREIGVTLSVTPTLLPDGTVRMKLRPRVATIVDLVRAPSGNVYPRVSESTVESISRVPSGKSLILGGFYDYAATDSDDKVPILGSIPVVGRLFKYDEETVEKVSLVFVITPTVYDASSADALDYVNESTRTSSAMELKDVYDLSTRYEQPEGKAGPKQGEPRPRRSWLKRVFNRAAPSEDGPIRTRR